MTLADFVRPVRRRKPKTLPPMQQPLSTAVSAHSAPRFYITGRQPLRPGAVLLAIVAAVCALWCVAYAFAHGRGHYAYLKAGDGRSPTPNSATASANDKDDPNQVDTIVLADAADAPVPGRRGDHVSPVHPFVVVHLPRFGDQVGLIPNSPAGHLLYAWLAAFNQANEAALASALPNDAGEAAVAAQMQLRQQTGGFNLLSAVEVTPGVLVFRVRDQTPLGTEALGTLQMSANSNPPTVATFSIRGVPSPHQNATAPAPPQ